MGFKPTIRSDIKITWVPATDAVVAPRMTRFIDDPAVVTAARQNKRQVGIREKGSFVNRPPRRDMIGFGPDNEHVDRNVLQVNYGTFHCKSARGQSVLEEKASKIF